MTTFTIIIPFRNETENLPKLLASIEKLEYPTNLFEVILVDDDSTDGWKMDDGRWKIEDGRWRMEDGGWKMVDGRWKIEDGRWRMEDGGWKMVDGRWMIVKNERKTNSPKKDAINTAIKIAQNEWIITTDADCVVPEKWLATFDAFIQENKVKMVASGVIYNSQSNFLENFQQLDLLSLQGTTIGSFGNAQAFMCNGANFCYKKDFFITLNGFEGNENIASGDDVFLLQKAIAKDATCVHFLKSQEAIVTTNPEATWKALFYQRVRWASKTANYQDMYSKQLGVFVFLINALLITTLVFQLWNVFVYAFAYKVLVDYLLFRTTVTFFRLPLRNLITSSLLYMFFCTAVVVYSLFGKYEWKGRRFEK
ncbi:MAG: glycosyltransferase [Limnohabitans sp.]|nr:glycosyltransferase [Limnohabitans sp.]